MEESKGLTMRVEICEGEVDSTYTFFFLLLNTIFYGDFFFYSLFSSTNYSNLAFLSTLTFSIISLYSALLTFCI